MHKADLGGIVRLTPGLVSYWLMSGSINIQVTPESQPMIRHNGLGTTVVAVDQGPRVFEFSGHGLTHDGSIEVPKCRFHVGDGLAAYWAAI